MNKGTEYDIIGYEQTQDGRWYALVLSIENGIPRQVRKLPSDPPIEDIKGFEVDHD